MARRRPGFTLIELLITISIVGIMAGMVLFVSYSAMEEAKAQKTRALVVKLDAIVKARWEAFKTRRVPIQMEERWNDDNDNGTVDPTDGNGVVDPGEFLDINGNNVRDVFSIQQKAKLRLDALHDLMRMELPERWSDVADNPVAPFEYVTAFKLQRTAASQGYLQKYLVRRPSAEHQGAECLYMIVNANLPEEGDSREVFRASDIGDTDQDGFPEFLDGWGRPIYFLRWAPGFTSELQTVASLRGNLLVNPAVGGDVHVVEIQVSDFGVSSDPRDYFGGAIMVQDDGTQMLLPNGMARIIGYQYIPPPPPPPVPPGSPPPPPQPGTGIFTCTTPSYTNQQPFDGSTASQTFPSVAFVVMAPDPFDPARVYPLYAPGTRTPANPDLSAPSFALYPLIYSAGADGRYGVNDEVAVPSLRYSQVKLYPFYREPGIDPNLIGTTRRTGDDAGAWLDNIHNHTQGQR